MVFVGGVYIVCKVHCVDGHGLPMYMLVFTLSLLTSTILFHVAFCMCKQASDFIPFIFSYSPKNYFITTIQLNNNLCNCYVVCFVHSIKDFLIINLLIFLQLKY